MRIVKLTRLPKDTDEQVAITVREMITLTQRDGWSPEIRWLAARARLPHQDARESAQAFNSFVRSHVAFQFDPDEVELVRMPSAIARDIRAGRSVSGDCDDLSLLLGTLIYSQGIPTAYVTISTSPLNREFRHVFVAAQIEPNGWKALDPSVSRAYSIDGLRQQFWYVPPLEGQPPRVLF